MNSARVKIKKTVESRIEGKPVRIQRLFYSCWAEIQQLYGTELYEAINIKLEKTLIFKVRYCRKLEQLKNKEEWFVEYENSLYKIYQPDFAKYPKKYVLIKCNLYR